MQTRLWRPGSLVACLAHVLWASFTKQTLVGGTHAEMGHSVGPETRLEALEAY